MGTELVVWILTVSLWSEDQTRVIYTHEFKDLSECMATGEGQISMHDSDPKRNLNEYMQATCTPKK